jgi:hypothetical protein
VGWGFGGEFGAQKGEEVKVGHDADAVAGVEAEDFGLVEVFVDGAEDVGVAGERGVDDGAATVFTSADGRRCRDGRDCGLRQDGAPGWGSLLGFLVWGL